MLGTLLASLAIAVLPGTSAAVNSERFYDRTPYTLFFTPDTESGIANSNYSSANDVENSTDPVFGAIITIENVAVDRYDAIGNYLTTEYVDSITGLVMRGVNNRNHSTALCFPDTVAVVYNGKILTRLAEDFSFDYYTPEQSTEAQSFPCGTNNQPLKNVYLPATAKSVSWRGQDFVKLRNFHFCTSAFPHR